MLSPKDETGLSKIVYFIIFGQDPSPLLSKNYRNQEETLENSNNKSETNFSDLQLKYDALQKENESLKQQVKSADLKLDILGQTWLTDDTINSYFQNSPTTDLISLDGPNQNNSFDCGVYLLHAVDYILLNFNSKNFFQNIKIPDFSENDCAKKRSYIAYVIKNGILTPKDIVLSFINQPSSNNNDYDSIKTHIGENDLSIKNPRNQTKPEILCEKAIQTEQASPTIGYPKQDILPIPSPYVGDSHGRYLARKIHDKLEKTSKNKVCTVEPTNDCEISKEKQTFQIIVANMKDIIVKHQENASVAFAHSISADFDHDRHMTAGVAVIFKQQCGKPSDLNCVSSHLAYQNHRHGAGIYSLITKPKYYNKPKKTDYDLAFHQLAMDFERIQAPDLFSNRRGLSHDEFLEQIQGSIDCLRGTPSQPSTETASNELEISSQVPFSPVWRGWSTPQPQAYKSELVFSSHTPTQEITSLPATTEASVCESSESEMGDFVISEGRVWESGKVSTEFQSSFLSPSVTTVHMSPQTTLAQPTYSTPTLYTPHQQHNDSLFLASLNQFPPLK
ncbi:hypothetical protein J6590_083808 [Homalodisca vitripennis]|nr:hypothetical protein J6590_083808 [Homalodisca vitripennis]